MTKRSILLLFAVLLLLSAGCARKMIVNIDGMPVSTHEYNLTNQETGIRAVFVLCRYYREYEGKEYIIKPEYLDALHAERVDPEKTEHLILHLKVINLNRAFYSVIWEMNGPSKSDQALGQIYSGRLSRKDFYIKLPLDKPGEVNWHFAIVDESGDDLFSLPQLRYKVKGGETTHSREP
jgi:hypothetical protein